jgi:hypothetical protein
VPAGQRERDLDQCPGLDLASGELLRLGTSYHLVASYPGNAYYLASASASKTLKVAA